MQVARRAVVRRAQESRILLRNLGYSSFERRREVKPRKTE